jgi:hypothetical protein
MYGLFGLVLDFCSTGQTLVVSLDVGKNRRINVFADCFSEGARGVCCEVLEGDRVVVKRHVIGYLAHRPKPIAFKVLKAEDGDLVALTEVSAPRFIVVLHDFATGETWPGERAVGNRLLDRFVRAHQGDKYTLSEDVPGGLFLGGE